MMTIDPTLRQHIDSLNNSLTGFHLAFMLFEELLTFRPSFIPPVVANYDPSSNLQLLSIPARDASMQLYHFWCTICDLSKLQIADSEFDKMRLKKARNAFDKRFPHVSAIRGLIGHASTSKKRTFIDITQLIGQNFKGKFIAVHGNLSEAMNERTYYVGGTSLFALAITDVTRDFLTSTYKEIRAAAYLPA